MLIKPLLWFKAMCASRQLILVHSCPEITQEVDFYLEIPRIEPKSSQCRTEILSYAYYMKLHQFSPVKILVIYLFICYYNITYMITYLYFKVHYLSPTLLKVCLSTVVPYTFST